MLKIEHLTKKYGDKKAVDDLCLHIHPGEIYGISLAENKASLSVMRKCGFENVFSGIGLYQGVEQKIVKNVWRVK